MPTIHFNRYYRYPDLTQLLHAYAEEYPHLVKIESIGNSYEGRDIWVLTVTNFATGPDTEKPAFWVDGNIHAVDISTSTTATSHATGSRKTNSAAQALTLSRKGNRKYRCPP
jgi:murein tripeptide amidase MpaA